MKLYSLLFLVLFFFSSCNNNDQKLDGEAAETPAEMHPPAEAIPDSLSIVNDSAIVADTANKNRTSGDTVRGNP